MSATVVEIVKSKNLKQKPNDDKLGFGKYFTDHMFVMDYTSEKGWIQPKITPYEPISLDPAAVIFHYGQTVFEGMKAYRTSDNKILLFRPDENFKRLNMSSERLAMPPVNEEEVLEYLKQLINVEKDWVPTAEGTSLYIRPFIIATEAFLGLAASKQYKLVMILSPVGSYYTGGIKPVSIKVEEHYTRAVRGGTGMAKTAGNYCATFNAQTKATSEGFTQVLWLDAIEKKYVEEVGTSNAFFKVNGEVITPELSGSILPGITRKSVIEMLKDWGVPVTERKVSIEEIFQYHKEGTLEEVFSTGTAAVISSIGELEWNGQKITVNNNKIGDLSQKLYDTLTGIQTGKIADPYNWTTEVK
ncbi:branched chain amino acid aminotransferase [Anaerobacillus alkalilacustris]|uniref:Branched-chain-amino-acid aminotransferase n=1 Tax=Anaerobacillus alkalilacustris TaxID=393763 RepID=A0A1S2LZC6_9BACI|nr:branched-chain amino acid aminotransferase [Anaerobacillus alkalilacustris]OIJ16815.1 branched chain amino acid aminotransferase [Anaerobacillus alkalilacustris]